MNPNPSNDTKNGIKKKVALAIPILKHTILKDLHTVGGSHGLPSITIQELFSTNLFKEGHTIWEIGFGTCKLINIFRTLFKDKE
jgi:hypothetical protein